MKNSIDTHLLKRLKNSEYEAFDEIYNCYWEKLFAFAFKLTNDRVVTERIVQDIFIQLWEKRNRLNIINLKTYLYQSVKYQFFAEYKKKKRRIDLDVLKEELENYLLAQPEEAQIDKLEYLSQAIESLPKKRKEILIMNKYQEMNISQIAITLNIAPQTVKNQLTAAIKQLRSEFNKRSYPLLLIIYISWLVYNSAFC